MKLTLIGGGGVRSPLFVGSTLRRAERIGLREICLMDVDESKLGLIGGLCQQLVQRAGEPVRLTQTADPRKALEGARYVVTSIRVGAEPGRVLDERIALENGVLGQETTGPGGFAMALRSIPAVVEYARILEEVSPGAWIFNFTNPAGLVTQALRDLGFQRTIGICDSANGAQHAIARWLGVDPQRLRPEVFGLNHLSWTRRVLLDGEDVLPQALRDREFLATTRMNIFDPELIEHIGMWLNEYLYYYYYAEHALDSIRGEERTRGEEVLKLNHRLLEQLHELLQKDEPQKALALYESYEARRSSTYMHYARPDAPTPEAAGEISAANLPSEAREIERQEGYAGVALDIIEALETGKPVYTALNVPNEGKIRCMRPDDVVEISCVIEQGEVRPLPVGDIPEHQELLMRVVKQYERLTVEAVLRRSRETAVWALMAHPLVLSYSRARRLVDQYLAAHARYIGEW